jgi:hypothetical protein
METVDHEKLAVECMEGWLKSLHDEAFKIADAHWKLVRDNVAKRPGWENQSRLQLRILKRGNMIRADWTEIGWVGSKAKGNRKPVRKYIPMKEEYGYRIKDLLALARDWEAPLVTDTEAKLSEIRRKARHINKALLLIRHATGKMRGKRDLDLVGPKRQ